MTDRAGAVGPLRRFVSHTPHDTNTFPPTRAILIETTGPVAVDGDTSQGGDQSVNVVIPGLLGGVWHPMRVTRIYDTGTTPTTVILGY